jgi:arsenate reductase
VSLLEEHGVDFSYREYTRDPLDVEELKELFSKLELKPRDLLRKRDQAYTSLGITGEESSDILIKYISEHPTLLERPIGILVDSAILGRPPERLLKLTI